MTEQISVRILLSAGETLCALVLFSGGDGSSVLAGTFSKRNQKLFVITTEIKLTALRVQGFLSAGDRLRKTHTKRKTKKKNDLMCKRPSEKLAGFYKICDCNSSPAAATAHIDYETKMLLFLVDGRKHRR